MMMNLVKDIKFFIPTSWGYVVTKKFNSKVYFFLNIIPKTIGFLIIMRKDRKAILYAIEESK